MIAVAILLCVATAIVIATLFRDREPSYRGKALSEWLLHYAEDIDADAAKVAIRAIGTNALPHALRWMRHQQPAAWQTNLQAALPNTITKNPLVADWLGEREDRLAAYSPFVFEILGTNAVGALPELDAMIRDFTKPMTVSCASRALGGVGEPAIPILEAAIDAPGFPDPHTVFHSLRGLAKRGNTDALRVSDKALAAQRAQVPWLVAPTPPTNTPTQ